MAAELVLLAVAVVCLAAGWALHAFVTRIGEARADVCLERMLAQRVARFPTGYAKARGGRRVLP